jgi:predicted nucleic acid-binding protein
MTRGDLLFLDTNILLSATDASRAEHGICRSILERAIVAGVHPVISGQVVREYLVVATRPTANNGLGLPPPTALENIHEIRTRAHLLSEPAEVTRHLLEMVESANLSGKRIHDANIAAVMIVHGVTTLATANGDDYTSLPYVSCRTPADTLRAIDALMAG